MVQTVTQPVNLQVRSVDLHRRDGLFCALLMTICLLLAYPFVEMGFIDDWSYIKTTQTFLQTGHFIYNGWAAMPLGWQVLWGALFSKLLGFSFIHVRLSILPLAAASVYLYHQILIRFGLARTYAIFGALALALSPIFMLMSASYMTDIPGLFCTLLCLYLCQRALAASMDRAALGWLYFAAVANIGGGTVRQTAWLGVLVMVPSTAWLLRRRRGLLMGGALLWLAGVIGVLACMHWVNHQPYFVPESVSHGSFALGALKHAFKQEIQALLCLLLLLFPILVAWFPLARFLPRRLLLWASVISSVLLTGFLLYCTKHGILESWTAPWIPHVVGLLRDGGVGTIPGPVPFAFQNWQRIIITAFVLGAALLFCLHPFTRVWGSTRRSPVPESLSWYQMFWLLAPFTLSYLGALILQGTTATIWDRYLLPLQAVGIIFLLRYHQDLAAPGSRRLVSSFSLSRPHVLSYLALLVFAYYSIAGTHDCFAVDRARLQAVEEVRHAGVPRTAIQGGFEYDSWTQVEAVGYINNAGIRIPQNAYHPVSPSPDLPGECTTWFLPTFTPAVVPRYVVVSSPRPCFAPSPFLPVTYNTWMPPFTRQVYVQQQGN
jgi:hypothetical protein